MQRYSFLYQKDITKNLERKLGRLLTSKGIAIDKGGQPFNLAND